MNIVKIKVMLKTNIPIYSISNCEYKKVLANIKVQAPRRITGWDLSIVESFIWENSLISFSAFFSVGFEFSSLFLILIYSAGVAGIVLFSKSGL